MSDNTDNRNTIEDQIDELIASAEDLKKNGYTLLDQSVGGASSGILNAQKQAYSDLKDLAESKKNMRPDGKEGWEGFKDNFHNFFAKMRVHHFENEIGRDVNQSQSKADKAEDNAMNALDHAEDALKSAKVAVLDAVQARAYAMELQDNLTTEKS